MTGNIRDIKIGSKYTIVTFRYSGQPYQLKIKVLKFILDHDMEHNESYLIDYVNLESGACGKIKLNEHKQFVLWEGSVNPDSQIGVVTYIKDSDQGHVQLIKRWKEHDPRYMVRAKLSVNQFPLCENIFKPSNKEHLVDVCQVIS